MNKKVELTINKDLAKAKAMKIKYGIFLSVLRILLFFACIGGFAVFVFLSSGCTIAGNDANVYNEFRAEIPEAVSAADKIGARSEEDTQGNPASASAVDEFEEFEAPAPWYKGAN